MHDNPSAFGEEPAWTPGDASSCPTPHAVALYCGYVLAKFVRGQGSGLNRDEAEQIAKHMSQCARCVAMFNAIVDVSRESGDGAAPLCRGPIIALGALATAALALVFMVLAEPVAYFRSLMSQPTNSIPHKS